MTTLKQFRSFDLAQRETGESLEIERTDRRLVCLTFDTRRLCFAELCALLGDNGLDDEDVREFTERAHVAASIVHPRWAALFDSGIDDGVYYYAREFVDGERLGNYIRRLDSVSNRLALDVVLQLGEAIQGLGENEHLIAEVDLNDARIFCNRQGGLELKMAGFPLEPAAPDAEHSGDSPVSRLRRMFEILRPPAFQQLMGEMHEAEALDDFMRRVSSIRARYPATVLEGKQVPQRVIEREIFQRWRPREFLSQEFRVIADMEDPSSPYTEALEGPNKRQLRLQVLPPVRMLRDEFLTFYKTGVHPAAIAVHAEWKNEDFRLIAEEKLTGASLATILGRSEKLNPVEAHLLIGRVDAAITDLEGANISVPDFQPENIFLCPAKGSVEDISELRSRRPFAAWPEFTVRIRTHLTMAGLVHPPDAAEEKAFGNSVFLYLALFGQGLKAKARKLAEEVSAAAAAYVPEVEIEAEVEDLGGGIFVSPSHAGRVNDEPESVDWDLNLDSQADEAEGETDEYVEEMIDEVEDEPVHGWEEEEETAAAGFGWGLLEGAGDDYDEDERDPADVEDESTLIVLSPIAAAMGIHEDEAFHDNRQVEAVEYPAIRWESRGHGLIFWILMIAAGIICVMVYLRLTNKG